MADEPTNQKDQYLRVLSDAEREARDLVQTGHDLVRAGQLAADMAALHRQVVSQVPDDRLLPDVCHRQIDSWSSWRDGAIKFKHYSNVGSLEAAITEYIAVTNEQPRPFRWTKSADEILASVERFCRRTSDSRD
jgi:hypothetical protein